MSVPERLAGLVGDWVGTNRLWLTPYEPVRESETTASVALAAQGQFATLRYTWAEGGEPQEGLLVLAFAAPQGVVQAVWIDSWHMADKFMVCQGEREAEGGVSVQGSYAAPSGPDWGWRIVIQPGEARSFRFAMYNILPDGLEVLAVEALYSRHP